jgi:hypothetical protein
MCGVRRIHSHQYLVCLGSFKKLKRDVRAVAVDE